MLYTPKGSNHNSFKELKGITTYRERRLKQAGNNTSIQNDKTNENVNKSQHKDLQEIEQTLKVNMAKRRFSTGNMGINKFTKKQNYNPTELKRQNTDKIKFTHNAANHNAHLDEIKRNQKVLNKYADSRLNIAQVNEEEAGLKSENNTGSKQNSSRNSEYKNSPFNQLMKKGVNQKIQKIQNSNRSMGYLKMQNKPTMIKKDDRKTINRLEVNRCIRRVQQLQEQIQKVSLAEKNELINEYFLKILQTLKSSE